MIEIDLKNVKKAHFVGIGGIGMSAIARMFLIEGRQVSGSDMSASEITSELEKIGAKILIGQDEKKLPDDTDLVIYTVAIPENNPELKKARELKIPMLSYPETLGLISKEKFTIAVAGTHGKTTTTAMVATAMIEAKLDPTVVVGSLLKDQKSNFVAGKSNYFVVEACEYKRSFLNLDPNILIITNIDDDHLDYYGDLAGVQKGFREMAEKLGEDDFLICNPNDGKVKPILEGLTCTIFDYTSVSKNIKLRIPGDHNIQNAKAALVALGIVGITEKQALESLSVFSGTWRRFDYKGKTKEGTLIYDDYAHHPSEIKATLAGAREFFNKRKIITVFQPHLYSRTKEHLNEFAEAFKDSDTVILAPIYAAREPEDKSISSEILAEKIRRTKDNVIAMKDFPSIISFLKEAAQPTDIVITMGAGDINKVALAMIQ
jgi:UDP-N-acetylmuramate--alanine ligase